MRSWGEESGRYNTEGWGNAFFGFSSGKSNVTGFQNVFMGYNSGVTNSAGYQNVFLGAASGSGNTSGDRNTFLGTSSGYVNTTGVLNTYLGYSAGGNAATGSRNTLIGFGCGGGLVSGSNNTFLGYVQTSAATSETIILANGLGNQGIYVDPTGKTGIHLGNNVVPQNTLEVKHGTLGNSGLRLTSLRNSDPSIANTTTKVLSVNASGDVVLVNDIVGTGSATSVSAGTNINVAGDPVSGYTISSPYQSLSLSGNILSISGGNTVQLPIYANIDTSIYENDGTLATDRVVTMNNNDLIFNTSGNGTNAGGRIYVGNTTAFTTANFPTATGDYRMYIEGGILTEKVKVALKSTSNWADYVFANDYKLMPLSEVEAFVKENKHLPGVASAKNINGRRLRHRSNASQTNGEK
ncbi:hypothetical protein LZZ90_07295 [Flavobacterium sp. SM15]|uniref:hypothetical protein n=1 Tax=Flavobacterium sp. SM15 TaxID=2908005 RepID=UPI001EDAF445|nr:hypothetical protein [Flavobacterium sp. SM15]MCG2611308.1 hypothetical protein [Flavobacterium sp. SM15]